MSGSTHLVFNADVRTQDASGNVVDAIAWRVRATVLGGDVVFGSLEG